MLVFLTKSIKVLPKNQLKITISFFVLLLIAIGLKVNQVITEQSCEQARSAFSKASDASLKAFKEDSRRLLYEMNSAGNPLEYMASDRAKELRQTMDYNNAITEDNVKKIVKYCANKFSN